jgi:ATP-binding protein involved in chromosome partitioning
MFICPNCGAESHIFGHGGAKKEAKNLKVDFLGELPLHMDIRTTSDAGTPIVLEKPNGDHASIYKEIAGSIWSKLNKISDADQKIPPRILVS